MKSLVVDLPEPVYRLIREESARRHKAESEVAAEAIQSYLAERAQERRSLADLEPVSLGKVLKTPDWSEDLLDGMVS